MGDRTYIILQEPGLVPEKKRPLPERFGVERMLLALRLCRPAGTVLTVCRVSEYDLDVESGNEVLSIFRSMFPRLSKRIEREVAAEDARFSKQEPRE